MTVRVQVCADTDVMQVTAFGAATDNPRTPGLVLRARASTAGIVLADVDDVDLAAAAAGAEMWMAVTGALSLGRPTVHGREAVEVWSALLARAAGHGTDRAPLLSAAVPADAVLNAAERVVGWAAVWFDVEAGSVMLERVAGDLSAAGPGTVFTAAGDLLRDLSTLRRT